jgi:hypothetical protein
MAGAWRKNRKVRNTMTLNTVNALWNKMLVVYGSEWDRKFSGMPLDEVKGAWADELRGFSIDQIKYALTVLPERAPNLIQFKDLCAKAPRYFDKQQLGYRPKPSPEKLEIFRKFYQDRS